MLFFEYYISSINYSRAYHHWCQVSPDRLPQMRFSFHVCVCVCVLSPKQYYLSPLSSFYMNNLLFHPFGLTHRTAVKQSHRETKMSHNENGICSTNQPDLHSNEFINVIKSVLLRLLSGFPTHLWVGTPDQTGPLLSILAHWSPQHRLVRLICRKKDKTMNVLFFENIWSISDLQVWDDIYLSDDKRKGNLTLHVVIVMATFACQATWRPIEKGYTQPTRDV